MVAVQQEIGLICVGEGAAIKASGGQLLFRLVAEFESAAQVAD